MGIDIHGSRLLAFARQNGVDFSRTATLGHQSLHTPPAILRSLLRKMGVCLNDADFERIATAPYADGLLEVLGAREVVSIDASPYERATIVHDMNRNIPVELDGRFSAVIDGGTLEHVFDFPTAIRNCMRMVEVGGHFLSVAPANNFMGHGFYQFSPELFYRVLSPENGFELRYMFATELRYGASWYAVADPMDVRKRVELINHVPTYLLLIARRTAPAELIAEPPQQSDYEQIDWQNKRTAGPGEGRGRGLLRSVAPGWLRDLGAAFQRRRTSFDSGAYRRVAPGPRSDSGEQGGS